MRKNQEVTLEVALQEMIKALKLTQPINQVRFQNIWEQKMGSLINRQTRSVTLRGKVLRVEIESAPLRMELAYGKEKIRETLNLELGEAFLTDVIIC